MFEQKTHRPTHATIDLENLGFNFRSVKQFIGEAVKFMAVVKANAYGHGSVECARRLEAEGADWFAVATLEEAVELRNAGVRAPILCLGGVWPGQAEEFIALSVTPTLFSLEAAKALNSAAGSAGIVADVHLKVDTGMGRVGVMADELSDFLDQIANLENIRIDGLMTHLAAADLLDENAFTEAQIASLDRSLSILRSKGHEPTFVDAANSPGAIVHPSSRCNMVRLGGVLYGLGDDVLPKAAPKPELKPVMSLKTNVSQLKLIPTGGNVGYGRTFVASRETSIATIPIGYHDGYRRALSGKAKAIVGGRFANVIGRVSMDWCVLDVTDISDVQIGDEVVLIGTADGLTIKAEDLAVMADTISYEITCGIGSRVPRNYI